MQALLANNSGICVNPAYLATCLPQEREAFKAAGLLSNNHLLRNQASRLDVLWAFTLMICTCLLMVCALHLQGLCCCGYESNGVTNEVHKLLVITVFCVHPARHSR